VRGGNPLHEGPEELRPVGTEAEELLVLLIAEHVHVEGVDRCRVAGLVYSVHKARKPKDHAGKAVGHPLKARLLVLKPTLHLGVPGHP